VKARTQRVALAALAGLLLLLASCVPPAPLDPRYWQLRNQPPPRFLPVPVAGVSSAMLRDSYGDPRSGGRSHEGIDIFAPRGTAVSSATEGYVSRVGNNSLGGNVVWVVGPAGWRHYYAHLDRWSDVREGDWVEPGRVIGFVGSSGNAAGASAHLHYGIYPPEGGTLNPYPLLAAGPGPFPAHLR
jgi:murein DD-endopeptidase MepM/ murein hydrolase activator NlpD